MVERPLFLAIVALAGGGAVLANRPAGDLGLPTAQFAEPARVADRATTPALKTKGAPLRIARAADGLFYLVARVNGTPVRFVVDTGASMVVLARRDAVSAGVATAPGGAFETAGGATLMARGRIAALHLGGHAYREIDAAVADTDLRASLMGQNLLARLGTISMRGDWLEITPSER